MNIAASSTAAGAEPGIARERTGSCYADCSARSSLLGQGIPVHRGCGVRRRAGYVEENGAPASAVYRSNVHACEDQYGVGGFHFKGQSGHECNTHGCSQAWQHTNYNSQLGGPEHIKDNLWLHEAFCEHPQTFKRLALLA